MPGDEAGSADEVLAALVASLRSELAESQAGLARAFEELAQAQERIAELEARLKQTPRNSSRPPSSEGLGKPAAVAAEEDRPQAWRAGRASGQYAGAGGPAGPGAAA